MLIFKERGKPEYPEKNLSEQRREPTTNSTYIWCRRRDLNPCHIGGRRALSPLRHPLLPTREPCKGNQKYLGLWISSRGFRIPVTRFRISQAKISGIPESGILPMGRSNPRGIPRFTDQHNASQGIVGDGAAPG